LPHPGHAQDDGDEKKEKPPKEAKVKAEKPPKEKPEKAPKTKPEKPEKEKPAPEARETDDGGDDDGGEEDGKKKKKKGKKGDKESTDNGGGANTANERFHANNADSTVKHGYAVPCARYRRGTMEYIDKNNVFITIRRTRKKEVQFNSNRGMRETKTRKLTRDQKIDKAKSKTRLDREGKLKDKGNKLIFKIEWTSDCEYKLIFKRSKKPTRFKPGWEMDCRITKCYEDYYDCDCDMHDIMQYSSVRKKMTKSEVAARQRQEEESLAAKEAEVLAEEAVKAQQAEEAARIKAAEDEIFGPIKRIETEPDPGLSPVEGSGGSEEEKPGGPVEKPLPVEKKPEEKEKSDKAEDGEKSDKAPKEKKEKKEKTPKGDKAPKEKKEKKEKVPKEKKEKVPKEKKEKPAKEPKAPKEKQEKPPKEPKVKEEKESNEG
ncbi:MAG TPA: hypothetical protein VHS96_05065, partial [Bacteroidia bacterium]|nr:hypothetical protein [Bacteroidia bacterium]